MVQKYVLLIGKSTYFCRIELRKLFCQLTLLIKSGGSYLAATFMPKAQYVK